MRDVQATRRANLRMVVDQWDGPTNLAKKLSLSGPSYLSQLTHGNRPFTEKTARGFEDKLGLPRGWFDEERDPFGVRVDNGLLEQCVLAVAGAAEDIGVNVPAAVMADLVTLVYEQAEKTGAVDESLARRLVKLTTKGR